MDTTRVTDLEIEAPDPSNPGLASGDLNSNGGTMGGAPVGDTITGSVLSDGTISFGGSALHTLSISSAYTQSSNGTLSMRLDVSAASDRLTVGGAATLGGTLTLSALHSLSAASWTIITYASVSGNFASFNWPDNGTWLGQALAAGHKVTKS